MRQEIKLKVCGMRDANNVVELAAIKPDYIGFIFYPKSKRYVDFLEGSVLSDLPSSIKKTGVFVDESYEIIDDKIQKFKLDAIQLHGNESPEFCSRFRSLDIEVIKAVGVDNTFNFSNINKYQNSIDYFLFDTKTVQHGGSGRAFDWNLLKDYTLDTPYFLSGGLSIEHVPELLAIQDPRLYALDLNSRFELEPGLKDIVKLKLFFDEIKALA